MEDANRLNFNAQRRTGQAAPQARGSVLWPTARPACDGCDGCDGLFGKIPITPSAALQDFFWKIRHIRHIRHGGEGGLQGAARPGEVPPDLPPLRMFAH